MPYADPDAQRAAVAAISKEASDEAKSQLNLR